jgi:hypothetical protein
MVVFIRQIHPARRISGPELRELDTLLLCPNGTQPNPLPALLGSSSGKERIRVRVRGCLPG